MAGLSHEDAKQRIQRGAFHREAHPFNLQDWGPFHALLALLAASSSILQRSCLEVVLETVRQYGDLLGFAQGKYHRPPLYLFEQLLSLSRYELQGS